jgi:hypothetical protein
MRPPMLDLPSPGNAQDTEERAQRLYQKSLRMSRGLLISWPYFTFAKIMTRV